MSKKIVQSDGLLNTPIAPLQRGKTLSNGFPGYDTKRYYGEVLVMYPFIANVSRSTLTRRLASNGPYLWDKLN